MYRRGRRASMSTTRRALPLVVQQQAALLEGGSVVDSAIANRSEAPIKVGVIAEQTGPLSFVGLANANVVRMVIGDINAKGGLLGRPLELYLEDGATDDAVAAAKAAKLVEQVGVDVIFGGIYSSTRQAIKGPAVVEGKTLYIYPEQYEGQESDPLIFCTGPVPAQQVDPLIPWLMRETGAKSFYLPSADYIWPRVLNARVREVVTANGGTIVGEEYFPMDHADYRGTVERIAATGADVVFNTIVPPGVTPFFEELHDSGFGTRGGQLVCTYFDENFLNMVPAAHVEGLYGCLDYYQAVGDPFSRKLLAQYDTLYPGDAQFTGGSGCSGLYRGLRLWASAVEEAGSLEQADVIAALDHSQIAECPGGPAAMVPGQHHVRMNMYIARARSGRFEVVESLGAIDPQERHLSTPVTA
jgi:ABC-type branched-subunit amino acid transport system substrate-binding protein